MFRSKAVSSELPYVSCLLKVDTANRNLLANIPEACLKTHDELQSASFHVVICIKLHCNMTQIAVSSESSYRAICVKLQRHLMHVAIQFVLRCAEASIFSGLIYTPLDCC